MESRVRQSWMSANRRNTLVDVPVIFDLQEVLVRLLCCAFSAQLLQPLL